MRKVAEMAAVDVVAAEDSRSLCDPETESSHSRRAGRSHQGDAYILASRAVAPAGMRLGGESRARRCPGRLGRARDGDDRGTWIRR